ncbi:MAG: hypothetical protein V1734_03360, partial [Nanoarchaeota archaeon]
AFLLISITACNKIECNKPYIKVGASCCLDNNDNLICDNDEAPVKNCPANCDDTTLCTTDSCSEATSFECKHEPITPCCGNSICEIGEGFKSCSADCKQLELKDLVLKEEDLSGYAVREQGVRTQTDVDITALDRGWSGGYFVEFTSKQIPITLFNNYASLYPSNNMKAIIENAKQEVLDEPRVFDDYSSITFDILNDFSIGDNSLVKKVTYESKLTGEVTRMYIIQFTKGNIYEYMETQNYELLKESANKLYERLPNLYEGKH